MPFHFYGRKHKRVWSQTITRYFFLCSEKIVVGHEKKLVADIGTRFKITKREAQQYYKRGYIKRDTFMWDEAMNKRQRHHYNLTQGSIHKDVESRYLDQSEVMPEEVAPKKKKK
jgi:hypothetical protein